MQPGAGRCQSPRRTADFLRNVPGTSLTRVRHGARIIPDAADTVNLGDEKVVFAKGIVILIDNNMRGANTWVAQFLEELPDHILPSWRETESVIYSMSMSAPWTVEWWLSRRNRISPKRPGKSASSMDGFYRPGIRLTLPKGFTETGDGLAPEHFRRAQGFHQFARRGMALGRADVLGHSTYWHHDPAEAGTGAARCSRWERSEGITLSSPIS
jgi:hypothetical protein